MYGIINSNSNCYLNVILQIFLNSKHSINLINSKLEVIEKQIPEKQITQKIIIPTNFLKMIEKDIDILSQNDAHEAFLSLIDNMPILKSSVTGKIKTYFKCTECNKTRTSSEEFYTINIYSESISESIKNLVKEEKHVLGCDNCKKNTNTIKHSKIKQIGNLLIFYNINKNNFNTIPYNLIHDKDYKLTGIIKHFGNKNGGHYVYIDYKNKILFNDEKIIVHDDKEFTTLNLKDIYLLVYSS